MERLFPIFTQCLNAWQPPALSIRAELGFIQRELMYLDPARQQWPDVHVWLRDARTVCKEIQDWEVSLFEAVTAVELDGVAHLADRRQRLHAPPSQVRGMLNRLNELVNGYAAEDRQPRVLALLHVCGAELIEAVGRWKNAVQMTTAVVDGEWSDDFNTDHAVLLDHLAPG